MLSRRCSEDTVFFHWCYIGSPELLAQPCRVGLIAERLLMGCRDWVGFSGWVPLLPTRSSRGWWGGVGWVHLCQVLGEACRAVRLDRAEDGGWSVTLVWGCTGKACASN